MKHFFIALLLGITLTNFAQLSEIPAPLAKYYHSGKDFSWHHEVVDYFQTLQSLYPENVRIEEYGKTYEGRPLFLAYIGNKETIRNLETIRKNHLQHSPEEKTSIAWLSYNVHGNESCGTEAAMETAYLLLTKNADLLNQTLVVIDPCLNPDGRDRYVNYFKQYHGKNTILALGSAEHQEEWPGGRPNHYLFDLNRDWAWLTQIESQSRIKVYNQWLPHVHVDFHEQGMNEPYYFPPAAEPYHEVVTNWQRDFQKMIGKNHASYFDKEGWLYFSKEIFDLLYPSYGDTYPTFNGAIGMTYEQGGSGRAGLGVITMLGDTLSLEDRILHHITTGISTVETVSKNHNRMLEEFQKYFGKTSKFKYNSYLLDGNAPNVQALLKLLDAHGIAFGSTSELKGLVVKGYDYFTQSNIDYKVKETDIVVNTNPEKGNLIQVLFEPSTKLSDSLTYDITAWSLPYAYGIPCVAVEKQVVLGNRSIAKTSNKTAEKCYAYAVKWRNIADAKFLGKLLAKDLHVSFSEKDFTYENTLFSKGSLVIIRGENQGMPIDKILMEEASAANVELTPIFSGMMDQGPDIGSSTLKKILHPKVGILYNTEASSLSLGEIWHFMDVQLDFPVQMLRADEFNAAEFNDLNVLFIPEGFTSNYNADLKEWIRNGGTCIVMGSAASNFMEADFGMTIGTETPEASNLALGNYANMERSSISETIIGAIYKCETDETHPLAFGYGKTYFTLRLTPEKYPFSGTIVQKIKDSKGWVSGFSGYKVKAKQDSITTVGVQPLGEGCIVYFFDNPLFRGFWENGKLQVANALFFVNKN